MDYELINSEEVNIENPDIWYLISEFSYLLK